MKRIDSRICGLLIRQTQKSVRGHTHLKLLEVLAKRARVAPEMAAAVAAAIFGYIVLAAELATGSVREDGTEIWHKEATDIFIAKHDAGSITRQEMRGTKESKAAAMFVTGSAAGVPDEMLRVEGSLDGTVNTARAPTRCTADAAVAAILAEC